MSTMAHQTSSNCMSSLAAAGVDGSRLIWVDLELTGLDPKKAVILEVACVVTEWNLEEVGERLEVVIHQPAEVLDNMNSWCQQQHREVISLQMTFAVGCIIQALQNLTCDDTGLIEAVKRSSITIEQAENQLLDYVKKYTPPGQCALAGNSVYWDRLYLAQYMPKLNNHLHERIIDVSTVKELCRRWNRDIFSDQPRKLLVHRALDNIIDSINEMKHYKQFIFDPEVNLNS